MKKYNILLIQPRPDEGLGFKDLAVIEPLGLEMVAAALEKEGHQVAIVDLFNLADLPKALQTYQPQLCGINCSFTIDVYRTLAIARAIKEANPAIKIFIGGHHASLNPADFKDPSIDCLVIGEGEITAVELVRCWAEEGDLTQVAGLVINHHNRQFATCARPLIDDLDTIPLPARHLIRPYIDNYFLGLAKPVSAVETARGCPFHCNFCSVWRFYQGKSRRKSVERAVEEIAILPARRVLITDDNFLADVKRAMAIGLKLKEQGVKKNYFFQARSDTIVNHPEVIDLWQEIGLTSVFIGFEKITEAALQQVEKHNSVRNNEKALAMLQSRGINVIASFIVDPDFSEEDFEQLRQYIIEKRIQTPSFSILTPLPGTELYDKVSNKLGFTNWEQLDLLHAVLPTALPPPLFYREFASLYATAYHRFDLVRHNAGGAVRAILRRDISISHLLKIWRSFRRFARAASYWP